MGMEENQETKTTYKARLAEYGQKAIIVGTLAASLSGLGFCGYKLIESDKSENPQIERAISIDRELHRQNLSIEDIATAKERYATLSAEKDSLYRTNPTLVQEMEEYNSKKRYSGLWGFGILMTAIMSGGSVLCTAEIFMKRKGYVHDI
jgi:hypothetical protein